MVLEILVQLGDVTAYVRLGKFDYAKVSTANNGNRNDCFSSLAAVINRQTQIDLKTTIEVIPDRFGGNRLRINNSSTLGNVMTAETI